MQQTMSTMTLTDADEVDPEATHTGRDALERTIDIQGLVYTIRTDQQPDGSWRATVNRLAQTSHAADIMGHLGSNPLSIAGGGWFESGPDAASPAVALEQRIRTEVIEAFKAAKLAALDEANRRLQERNARKRPPWE